MLSSFGIKFGKQDPWMMINCVSCAKHHQMSLLALLALDVQHKMHVTWPLGCSAHAQSTSCMFSTRCMLTWPLACSAQGACSHDLLDVQHEVHACMLTWPLGCSAQGTCLHDLLDVQHILKKTLGCSAQGASHDFLVVKHKVHACMFTWTLGCSAQGTCSHDLLDGQHKVYAHMTSWVSSTRDMLT